MIDDLQVEMRAGRENLEVLTTPGICEGYLLKRRKWPLKGWHKVRSQYVKENGAIMFILTLFFFFKFQRYFVLEAGILRYSKNQQDVSAYLVFTITNIQFHDIIHNINSYVLDFYMIKF